MGGGLGLGISAELVHVLEHELAESQLVVVLGKNEQLQRKFQAYQGSARILHYIDDISSYMAAADLLATKPGGITCAEALARGLPMALFSPIPGQEWRNAAFLTEQLVAIQSSFSNFTMRLKDLLEDKARLEVMSALAMRLARPRATADLVSLLEDIIARKD
jgi:processive 1,2-diacylglycerol beta-glucosyltransferase